MGKIIYLNGTKDNNPEQINEEKTDLLKTLAKENMSETEFLYALASAKDEGYINITWDQVAKIMNDNFRKNESPETESSWRKKYRKIHNEVLLTNEFNEETDKNTKENIEERVVTNPNVSTIIENIERSKIKLRDERRARSRQIMSMARVEIIEDIFKNTIKKYESIKYPEKKTSTETEKAVYAMLSDIHYGCVFDNYNGKYNSSIAIERIMQYADTIIETGKKENANTCFISLMGDMISGNIHQTLRIENKENIIEQVIGVSDAIAEFIYRIAENFSQVYVNNVNGNHSRIDSNVENVLNGERLDALVPWYCKAKLQNITNVSFEENELDNTIGTFIIGDKFYVTVHGDMEKNLKETATKIEKMAGKHIDYLLAGHMHVAESRFEDTCYIRNGSVIGSGDEYTMKKRLWSPPYQVLMVVSNNGVEYIRPVLLEAC